jgi:hypothetical protein
MYTEQQAKCADHNREVVWIVITTFASALLKKDGVIHTPLLIAIFATAIVLRAIDTARYYYCYKKYQQAKDMLPVSGDDSDDAKACKLAAIIHANKATLTSQKIFNIQMAFYWIILVEFAIYCILCVCGNVS